jgi:peptide deformylase
MAILPICITGEPVLHQRASEVTSIDSELLGLISDMYETMEAAPGVGLAAPQIGIGLRVFVYDWDDGETHWRGVAINPQLELAELEPGEPDEDTEVEGCLSIPGERAPLRRYNKAILTALDETGAEYRIQASGWLARIFQHEFDHLDGVLYRDRLLPQYQSEIDEVVAELGWGVPGNNWLPGVDDLEG